MKNQKIFFLKKFSNLHAPLCPNTPGAGHIAEEDHYSTPYIIKSDVGPQNNIHLPSLRHPAETGPKIKNIALYIRRFFISLLR